MNLVKSNLYQIHCLLFGNKGIHISFIKNEKETFW